MDEGVIEVKVPEVDLEEAFSIIEDALLEAGIMFEMDK